MYYFVEPMHESDIARVQEIERQSFIAPWSANTYRRELNTPETSRYLAARASPTLPPDDVAPFPGRRPWLATLLPVLFARTVHSSPQPIVGYGSLWLMVDEADVTTLAVSPSERGQGIGELLLNGRIDQAIEMQASRLPLEGRR